MYNTGRNAYRQILPGVSLGVFVIIGMALLCGVSNVFDLLADYRWPFFGMAILLSLLNSFLRFLKRQYYLSLSGVGRLSFMKSIRLFAASFPLAATPIRVGESYKGLWLNHYAGIPVTRSISVYTIDHIFDGLSVFALSLFGSLAFPMLWPIFAIIFGFFVIAIFSLSAKQGSSSAFELRENLRFLEVYLPDLRKSIEENPMLFRPGIMTLTFIMGLVSWFADGLALYFILLGLGLTASWVLVGISFLVFSFSLLIGVVSNLPGGLGVVELAMAAFLTIFLGAHPGYAVVATILFRLVTFWAAFGVGMLVWTFSGKNLGIQNQEGRVIES